MIQNESTAMKSIRNQGHADEVLELRLDTAIPFTQAILDTCQFSQLTHPVSPDTEGFDVGDLDVQGGSGEA